LLTLTEKEEKRIAKSIRLRDNIANDLINEVQSQFYLAEQEEKPLIAHQHDKVKANMISILELFKSSLQTSFRME
jgi:hypothetical protein